jgi:site-specific DNA-methyltransferase (adenine-specific)
METYLENTMKWVKEVWRVLKPTGSFIFNIGDCFCSSGSGGIYKTKQLLSVSSFAYCKIISETDFVCRGEHIWCKSNVPTPIRSRLKHSHEKLFWFVKDADKYYFNEKPWLKPANARDGKDDFTGGISVNGDKSTRRDVNLRRQFFERQDTEFGVSRIQKKYYDYDNPMTIESSWRIINVGEKQKGFELYGKEKQEHIAPFPEILVKPYLESLCPKDGTVLDPFLGSGTTLKIARDLGLNGTGIELNPSYAEYSKKRINWNNGIDGNEYELVTI